jgi:pimeloyl-ACP methyl ester carboxylesterase
VGAPVMVSAHGISGNAVHHAALFSPACDAYGVVMLAPVFTQDQHQDYQRLGRKGRGNRADLLLHEFLAEVASLSGADTARVYLFGFSAGAQFAHRYAMVHPHRVARAAVAAAGWYTFPDHRQRFPYGIRPAPTLEGVTFNPEEFLRVPIDVFVGGLDTTTENMRNTARTVAQQGRTRLDRARNWVAAMREAATTFGLEPRVTLTEVAGIGHSFTTFCERGNLVELVSRSLFSDAAFESGPAPETEAAAGNGRVSPAFVSS